MAANIFDASDRSAIFERLAALGPNDHRVWGTMTPAEMLRHCRAQIDMVLNPRENQRVYSRLYPLPPVRWLALYGIRWPRNVRTAPEMDVRKKLNDTGEFEQERKLLMASIDQLASLQQVSAVHPLFGRMGRKDWGRTVWKHLDHHLRQFGC